MAASRGAAGDGGKGATKKPAKKTTRRRSTAAGGGRRTALQATDALAKRLEEVAGSLLERLEALEARLGSAPAPDPPRTAGDSPGLDAAVGRLQGVAGRLDESCGRLTESLGEVPRPADFEPLAEHLYAFAAQAPRLLDALEAIPRAAAPIEKAVAALQEIAETLQYAQQSFSESLLQLPRAEDYEPLAAPLAEFARVSPALAESLADVLRVTSPLTESVADLRQATRELRATEQRLAGGAVPASAFDSEALAVLTSTAAELRDARAALQAALDGLPRDPEYKRVAGQLRELASVSPSLMEWLEQVTPLSQPLGESVTALRETADRLEAGHRRLRELLARLGG